MKFKMVLDTVSDTITLEMFTIVLLVIININILFLI